MRRSVVLLSLLIPCVLCSSQMQAAKLQVGEAVWAAMTSQEKRAAVIAAQASTEPTDGPMLMLEVAGAPCLLALGTIKSCALATKCCSLLAAARHLLLLAPEAAADHQCCLPDRGCVQGPAFSLNEDQLTINGRPIVLDQDTTCTIDDHAVRTSHRVPLLLCPVYAAASHCCCCLLQHTHH